MTPARIKLGGMLVFLTIIGYLCADTIAKGISLSVTVPPMAVLHTSSNVTTHHVPVKDSGWLTQPAARPAGHAGWAQRHNVGQPRCSDHP